MISVFLSATCLIVGFFLYRKIEEIRSDRRQHLFMYCPKCGNELIKNGLFLDNTRDMNRYKCSRCGDISTWDVAHFPIPVLITCSDCVYLKFNSGGGEEGCQECSPENKVKFKYKGGNVTND